MLKRRGSDRQRWFTLGIGSIGATSLLSDTGHEMVTAILPSFVIGTLGGSAATLGLIEGCADALTGLSRLAGGPAADDPRRRRALAGGGYTTTAFATALIGLTSAIWQVGVLRGISWAARGLRSPARDALLASLARQGARGRAFGVERAGDNLGAVIGPLLGGTLAAVIGLRTTILVSVIPGLLAACTIMVAARRAGRTISTRGTRDRMKDGFRQLRAHGFGRVLVPIALFEAGNLAATLLILRSNQLLMSAGMTTVAAVGMTTVLYAGYNASAALVSLPAGALIDRVGSRTVLSAGALAFVASYLGFAFVSPRAEGTTVWLTLVCFVLGGVGIGFGETAQSTLIADSLPDRLRGSGYGVFGLVQAAGDITATVVGGLLYTALGPLVCFGYAALWMVSSAVAAPDRRRQRNPSARRDTREGERP